MNLDDVPPEIRKEWTRQWARQDREAAIARAAGLCEACGWRAFANGTLAVHHIRPVSDIGTAWEVPGFPYEGGDNLVCLCPNCHAVVHWLLKNQSDANFEALAQWCPRRHFERLYALMERVPRSEWPSFIAAEGPAIDGLYLGRP